MHDCESLLVDGVNVSAVLFQKEGKGSIPSEHDIVKTVESLVVLFIEPRFFALFSIQFRIFEVCFIVLL